MLLGDLNINRSFPSSHPSLPILNSIEDKLGLKQVLSTATHTTASSSTITDYIYVSNDLTHSQCTTGPLLFGSDQQHLTNLHNQPPYPTAKEKPQESLGLQATSKDDVNTVSAEWSDVL